MDEISTYHTDKDWTKMVETTLMISIMCVRCMQRAVLEEWQTVQTATTCQYFSYDCLLITSLT